MNSVLKYKNFLGSAEFSIEDNCLHGKLLFIDDLVTYEADSVSGLKKEFQIAVDDYLETCRELGKEPFKPFKGSFNVRIGPELHQAAARFAKMRNIPLNELVKKSLSDYIFKGGSSL